MYGSLMFFLLGDYTCIAGKCSANKFVFLVGFITRKLGGSFKNKRLERNNTTEYSGSCQLKIFSV